MTDVWNNVTIYGPSAEIDHFRRACLNADEDIYRARQNGWDGCNCTISVPYRADAEEGPSSTASCSEQVWNFQQYTSDTDVEYSFSFDTDREFPVQLFERLAARFPRLAFHCTCIEAMDAFMGYGWFNAPDGAEEFAQNYDVLPDYWGSKKRNPVVEAAHEARVAKLKQAAIAINGTSQ